MEEVESDEEDSLVDAQVKEPLAQKVIDALNFGSIKRSTISSLDDVSGVDKKSKTIAGKSDYQA